MLAYTAPQLIKKANLRPLFDIRQRMQHDSPVLPIFHLARIHSVSRKGFFSRRDVGGSRRIEGFVSDRGKLSGPEKMDGMTGALDLIG